VSGSEKKESRKKRLGPGSTKKPKERSDKHGAQKNPDTSIQQSSSNLKGSSSHSLKKLTPGHDQDVPTHMKVVTPPITVSTTATGTTKVCIITL